MGGVGLSTGLSIAFTLGCGTLGGSSVSENVGPEHLINLKKLVYGIVDADKLAENDEIYQKYHGSSCHAKETCSVEKSLPEYDNHGHKEDNYFSYSPKTCTRCTDEKDADFHVGEEGINLESLQKMVDDMVKALGGNYND